MEVSEGLELGRKSASANGVVEAGAGLLAVLAGSCCILPIALALVGIGGSWVSLLGPFVAYRGYILLGVAGVLVWAWYRIRRQRNSDDLSGRSIVVTVMTTAAFVGAASAPMWEWEIAQSMWQTLVETQ